MTLYIQQRSTVAVVLLFAAFVAEGSELSRPSGTEIQACVSQTELGRVYGAVLRFEFGRTTTSQGGMMEMAMGAPQGTTIFPVKLYFPSNWIGVAWIFQDPFGTWKCERYGDMATVSVQDLAAAALAQAAKEPSAVKTPSGLIYRELRSGRGAKPKRTDTVRIDYHGTLADGTVFDSTVQRGKPATFPLTGVVPCWTEALQLMKVGGKAKVACPSAIAFGERGFPGKVEPGAAVFFELELLEIVQ